MTLELPDLSPRLAAGSIPAGADHWLFYVGRDDVHGALCDLLGAVTSSLYLNMYGYDDDALNELVLDALENPLVTVLVTLDKSQAGGVHERTILATDAAKDPTRYRASVAVGTSRTRQISHTKGGTIDGRLAFEGSTNWSTSGEGTFVTGRSSAGGAGYKAQNNTLLVSAYGPLVAGFTAELTAEHTAALQTGGARHAE